MNGKSVITHASLFSGIGGSELAADWMGWENLFHCEINEFGRLVIKYYWPNSVHYEDIKKTDFTRWRGLIHVLSGGFPCQPYSAAGKRLGTADDRHLWPEMLRAIREIQPCWVVGENVRGITNWNEGVVFDEVQADLEAEGYEVLPFLLPACAVNAPHRRDRIWFIAYSHSNANRYLRKQDRETDGIPGEHRTEIRAGKSTGTDSGNASDTPSIGMEGYRSDREQITHPQGEYGLFGCHDAGNHWGEWPTQSPLCSGDDGLPRQLDGITFSKWRNESIKAYGNAIVPQVIHQIFKAIQEYENI
jgi:DNA (cytosine-5)-methyltransferase 1